MPLFGELFLSEILKRPVLDPRGEEIGRLVDVAVVKGEHLPKLSGVIVKRKNRRYKILWRELSIFNKRVISSTVPSDRLAEYEDTDDDLLALRDMLDKQIVDIDGVKVVRVNDIKLEGYEGDAVVVAVDVGVRGILRRMGLERIGEDLLWLIRIELPYEQISWKYLQPLQPKLSELALTVPRQMVEDLHPADIADLISQVSPGEGAEFIQSLDVEIAAEALSELEPETQRAMISDMDPEHAANIVEEMPPDTAADLINSLTTEKAHEILKKIEKEDAEDIQELMGHEHDTAGGLMTNDFLAYPPQLTVREALARFRADSAETDNVNYIYVVDEEEKFQGVLSLKELILSPPERRLQDVMVTKFKSVRPEADEMEVAGTIAKYNLLALPVVDCDTCLVGIVTVDDVLDRILPSQARRSRRTGV